MLLTESDYDRLPESIKRNYTEREYNWLPDDMKRTLVQYETEPEAE